MNNYKIIFLLLLASTMSFAQPQASDSSKLDRGFNFIDYNLKHNQNNNDDFLDKGSYKVLIITDKDNLEKEFQIK